MVTNDTAAVRPAGRTARPTAGEIDAAILDTAAEVFARHGYAGTSVQQVADAVGYSKTGLLRRFASKQALYDAVLAHVEEHLDLLDQHAADSGQDQAAVVRAASSVAFDHPGAVLLMLEVLRAATDLPHAERLEAFMHRFIEDLTVDLTDPRDRVRAVLALQLVANAALLTIPPAPAFDLSTAQLHDLTVELACTVLGAPSGC